MTLAEKQMISSSKEIEKAVARIERVKAKIEKNKATLEKLGCADWTKEEWKAKRAILGDRARAKDLMFLEWDNEVLSQKQDSALWDKFLTLDNELEEAEQKYESAVKHYNKAMETFENLNESLEEQKATEAKENEWLAFASLTEEERKAAYEKWFKAFKAECAKDGVEIEYATASHISGKTKSGKGFSMYINNGWTTRSFHCYTLAINGETIFTSGLFSTGYNIIKK